MFLKWRRKAYTLFTQHRLLGFVEPWIKQTRDRTSHIVRDLGIYLDSDVSMRSHVAKTVSSCFAVLRSICQSVSRSVLQSLMSSLVLPRLDYGNASVAGIPSNLLTRIQSAMNAAARHIFSSSRFDHITPFLHQLHWLKASERIAFKCAVPVHKMPSRVCNVVPRRWTVSSGGRRGSSATPFCPVLITDRPSAALHCPPSMTVPFRLPLLVPGTVYPSTSLLHLRCLSSGHASGLIFLVFPIPVRDYVQWSRSDTCSSTRCHIEHFNRSCYLLIYRRLY